jgi:hypothetical protein
MVVQFRTGEVEAAAKTAANAEVEIKQLISLVQSISELGVDKSAYGSQPELNRNLKEALLYHAAILDALKQSSAALEKRAKAAKF